MPFIKYVEQTIEMIPESIVFRTVYEFVYILVQWSMKSLLMKVKEESEKAGLKLSTKN